MSNTSCTTTGLKVGDNEASRTPILAPVADNPDRLGVQAAPAGRANNGTINGGLSCGSQIPMISVRQVDHDALQGSNQGDHRVPKLAQDITAVFKNAPGPRDRVRQFADSSRETSSASSRSDRLRCTGGSLRTVVRCQ